MESSDVSSKLMNKTNKRPIRRESKRIETLMHSVVMKTEIYQFETEYINQKFKIGIEINKLEKKVLLVLLNQNYPEIQKSYNYLKKIIISDTDTKKELPVHVVLRTGNYAKI